MNIQKYYEEVVAGNHYDGAVAGQHNCEMWKAQTRAGELPEIEANFVRKHHAGCCLHFSMYLLYLLQQAGVECYLTITPEEDGANHCSVLYFDEEGRYFIADPVEDVKNGTKCNYIAINYDEFVRNAIRNEIAHYDVFGERYRKELFFEAPFLKDCKIELSAIIET